MTDGSIGTADAVLDRHERLNPWMKPRADSPSAQRLREQSETDRVVTLCVTAGLDPRLAEFVDRDRRAGSEAELGAVSLPAEYIGDVPVFGS